MRQLLCGVVQCPATPKREGTGLHLALPCPPTAHHCATSNMHLNGQILTLDTYSEFPFGLQEQILCLLFKANISVNVF